MNFHARLRQGMLVTLEMADDLLHLAIGLLLVAVAAATFVYLVRQPFHTIVPDDHDEFLLTVLEVVNNVLFVIIILEILRTITAHLKDESFALRPFLIIGIISAVRHLLIVGAHMSIEQTKAAPLNVPLLDHPTVELIVNALVALLMVVAYYIVAQVQEETQETGKESGSDDR